jgi:hypothetical protein
MTGKAMNWSRLASRHRMSRQGVEDGKGTTKIAGDEENGRWACAWCPSAN